MTPKEIDRLCEEMIAMRDTDRPRAFELSNRVIEESVAMGYERCLPDAHHIRGSCLGYMSKFEEAATEFQRAVAISRSLGNRVCEGRSTQGLGVMARVQEDFPLAKQYFDRALVIAEETNDTLGRGRALNNLAGIFDTWGLYEQATEYAQASYEALRGSPDEYIPLYELASLIFNSGDDQSALELYKRILDIPATEVNPNMIAASYAQIGRIYFGKKNYSKAREFFIKEEKIARSLGIPDTLEHAFLQIGECDIKLGSFDSAEKYLQEAIRLDEEMGREGIAGHPLLSLATLETARGNVAKALEYLADSEARMRSSGYREGDLDLMEAYSAAYEQLGDWQKVAHYEKERRRLNDERNSSRFKSRIAAAQALLATEQERKETELQKLRAEHKEKELSNSTLQLLAQTELLSDLRADLLQIARKIPPTEPAARELRERVKNLPCQSIDWEKFDAQFKAAHPEFVKKLLERFPELTPMETRVCTLLRLNLKSHEIAKMFCLEERSIETHRFNIRKKLKLETKQSLSNFLNAL